MVRFHLAFKRFGKDWGQIETCFLPDAHDLTEDSEDPNATIRTQDMIKALYFMNKTYLSLSSSNALDFAAIMADHYRYLSEGKMEEEDEPSEEEDSRSKQSSEEPLNPPVFEVKRGIKRVTEAPRAPVAKKLVKKQYETIEITSTLSDYQFPSICARKSTKMPLKALPDFSYSQQLFLVDYCQAVRPVPASPKFLNWCKCEWFYSHVDKGFFQFNEFEDCLKALGTQPQESMMLKEWRTLRSALGKPRRFSKRFILDERKRLTKYREAVKFLQQGKVLPSDYHDLVPYLNLTPGSVTPKLMVGTKVLAVHPRTKEVKSGSILTLDATKYHVQFDIPELGVCLISDTQLAPAFGEEPRDYSPSSSGFVFQPRVMNDREQGYPGLSGEKFKAGVNIYAMAFLLKLLERKEALLELLKKQNDLCQANSHEDLAWHPTPDFQQQYAWINERLEALRSSAAALLSESQQEIEEKTEKLLPSEQVKLKEFMKSSLVLLSLLDAREKDEQSWTCVEEVLNQLTPVCESNKEMYDRIRASVDVLKEKIRA